MQALALQPPLHVGEARGRRCRPRRTRSSRAAVQGEVAVVGCAHRGLPWWWSSVSSRAALAAARRCRRSAPPSPGARGPAGRPRIALTIRACWVSECAMLASRTGIALSISCSVDCTAVTASIDARRPGERGDGRGGTASRPARCTAGPVAVATASRAACSRFRCFSPRCTLAARAAAPGSTIRRNSRASTQSARMVVVRRRRGSGRRCGRPHRHDRAASAAPGGLHQSGLTHRGHRLAQGRAGHRQSLGQLPLGREHGAARVDAEPDQCRQLLHARLEGVVPPHRTQHCLGQRRSRGSRTVTRPVSRASHCAVSMVCNGLDSNLLHVDYGRGRRCGSSLARNGPKSDPRRLHMATTEDRHTCPTTRSTSRSSGTRRT